MRRTCMSSLATGTGPPPSSGCPSTDTTRPAEGSSEHQGRGVLRWLASPCNAARTGKDMRPADTTVAGCPVRESSVGTPSCITTVSSCRNDTTTPAAKRAASGGCADPARHARQRCLTVGRVDRAQCHELPRCGTFHACAARRRKADRASTLPLHGCRTLHMRHAILRIRDRTLLCLHRQGTPARAKPRRVAPRAEQHRERNARAANRRGRAGWGPSASPLAGRLACGPISVPVYV